MLFFSRFFVGMVPSRGTPPPDIKPVLTSPNSPVAATLRRTLVGVATTHRRLRAVVPQQICQRVAEAIRTSNRNTADQGK